jgi:aspartyl-tRNA(Asn)/glutamyl-tRNA(Gln) amidotransferase subunit C
MAISSADIIKVAKLAYLDLDSNSFSKLAEELSSIMKFMEQLNKVDTKEVEPLFHPLEVTQRLRPDSVTETARTDQLQNNAPLFQDNLYLVPKVIELNK